MRDDADRGAAVPVAQTLHEDDGAAALCERLYRLGAASRAEAVGSSDVARHFTAPDARTRAKGALWLVRCRRAERGHAVRLAGSFRRSLEEGHRRIGEL